MALKPPTVPELEAAVATLTEDVTSLTQLCTDIYNTLRPLGFEDNSGPYRGVERVMALILDHPVFTTIQSSRAAQVRQAARGKR
jgi:hypothetical protein